MHAPRPPECATDGFELIQVLRCVSIAHVLSAIALQMSRKGKPAELHFGWSDESPLAANLNFLLFGEGTSRGWSANWCGRPSPMPIADRGF